MKNKQWLYVAIIMALAILGYGYMNYTYKMKVLENEKQTKAEEVKREEEQKTNREMKLANCKLEAEIGATSWWNANCKNFGINKKTDDCTLPGYIADTINEKKVKDLDNCVKLYSAD